ncbi:MAG TPA: hypothetical protein VKE97_06535 [Acidimicrobiia bacterium]|nr:hypothetical protein [Acidimicrobiia bacterium]
MTTALRNPETPTVTAAPAQRWGQRLSPTAVGCVLAVVLAVWSTRGVWGSWLPAGEDVPAHLLRFDVGISRFVAHGRLDGWLERYYLGYQEFLFQGPGLTWAVAAVRGVTFGLLSNPGGIKVIGVLSFAAVPVAMAFVARSLGLGRLAAGIAAVLSLLVSSPVGVGLQGIYLWGLLPNQVGGVFFLLSLGALLRIPVDARSRWVILAGVSLAALTITHVISLIVLAVFFPILAIGLGRKLLRRDVLVRFGSTAALAFGLAAFWLVPALTHRELQGPAASWPTPPFGDRVDEIVDGRILFRPYTFWLVAAGWVYGLTRVRRRPFALVVVLAPIVYLVLAHWAASQHGNEYTLQLANRGLGYAGLLAILPLAALLAAGARLVRRRLGDRSWAAPAAASGAFVLAAIIVLSPLGPRRSTARELDRPSSQLQEAATVLRRVVPDGARFVTRRDLPEIAQADQIQPDRLGHVQPAFWLAYASGRNSLNGFGIESSNTEGPNVEADGFALANPPDAEADFLTRMGVTHSVTMTNELADHFIGSPRFDLVWRNSPIAVFAVRPRPGQPDPASLVTTDAPARARLRRADPERLGIAVDASRATRADIAVAWSPRWHATLDGRPVGIGHTGDGLITLQIPAGASALELAYEPDGWDRIGVVISALTLMVLAALGVLRWRRRTTQPG